jgi:D-arabinose 1-dehydrogenase-like Zn-dependent alcohol dehydrogenase
LLIGTQSRFLQFTGLKVSGSKNAQFFSEGGLPENRRASRRGCPLVGCAANGIPYRRNQTWKQERKACERSGRAHVYIDTAVDNSTAVLQRMGGARAILATAPSGDAMGPLVAGLAVRGKFIVVGVPHDLMQLSAFPLVFGGRSVCGSMPGTAIETEDALAFSVLENIRPMIETAPLEQAADAYARMMQGKSRFRMVLVTKDGATQSTPVN